MVFIWFISDGAAVINIDTSGICALEEVHKNLISHNIHVSKTQLSSS